MSVPYVLRAREVGTTQKVWRKLNHPARPRFFYVTIYQHELPSERKRRALEAILKDPHPDVQVVVYMVGVSGRGPIR